MTEKDNDNKIKDIVDSFEVAMKKGFMSGLILLVLQNEPCHGYKILKEIEKRTLGVWQPSSSNIYPLLESLSEKGLIECVEMDGAGRQKKVYAITSKGENAIKILIQKHSMMVDSIRSIILSTLGITDVHDPSFLEDLEKLISYPGMELIMKDSIDSKVEILKYNKELIKQRIKIMNKNLQIIENFLSKLESEKKNENINQKPQQIASHQSQK
ncbi:MAG: PadR family transcriptional regulator [Promethearchaeota archaeon]